MGGGVGWGTGYTGTGFPGHGVSSFMNKGANVKNPVYPYLVARVSFVIFFSCYNFVTLYVCFAKGYNDPWNRMVYHMVKMEPLVSNCKMCINCKKHGAG